jgi:hypothetical protein
MTTNGSIAYFDDFSLACLALRTHIDDEYGSAGVKDPKVLVTTSRDPTQRLVQFAKVSEQRASFFYGLAIGILRHTRSNVAAGCVDACGRGKEGG